MSTTEALHAQLQQTLSETDFPSLGTKYRGKVRDVYRDGERLVLVTTDRLSAFDRVLTTVPFKGEILNRLAGFWFEKTKHLVPNHVLSMPDPNVIVGRRCVALPIEVVVRRYITGSLWRDHQAGKSDVYGVPFSKALRKSERFDAPVITPSTKAEIGLHDEPISEGGILSRGLATKSEWEEVKRYALALFGEGERIAAAQGLLFVDTKYEFGRDSDGQLRVIDEMHTPDSSRFWEASEYEARFKEGADQKMLDKENIRQWLLGKGFSGNGPAPEIPGSVRVELAEKYLAAYRRLTGGEMTLTVGDVKARIAKNLGTAGLL